MHRLVAILLIPIFMVGNSFAHSHVATAHSENGQGRVHIHMGGVVHHGALRDPHRHSPHHQHSHDEDHCRGDANQYPVGVPVEHDSDAIYLVAAEFAINCGDRASVKVDSQVLDRTSELSFVVLQSKIPRSQPDYLPPPEPPLYLLHAALRL